MRILRESADDLDVGVGSSVRLVDDAGRRLAARHQQQRRAHVLGLCDPARHAAPDPEFLQGCLAVLAGGNGIDIGHRQAAVTQQLGQVEARLDLDRRRLVLGRDQHDAVAEQVGARLHFDQVFLRDIVHPVEVGRDEHLRRRALLDLLGQRGAGGVRNRRLPAGLLLPLRVDRIERSLEARGREHHHISALRPDRRLRRSASQQCGGHCACHAVDPTPSQH